MEAYYGISPVETQMARFGYAVLKPSHLFPVREVAHVVVLDGKLFFKDGPTPNAFPCGHDFSFDILNIKGRLQVEQTSNSPFTIKIIESQKKDSDEKAILLMKENKRAVTFMGKGEFFGVASAVL